MKPVQYIGQRNGDDCVIAASAMALGLTYEEVEHIGKPVFDKAFSKEHGIEADDCLEKLVDLAYRHGLGLRDDIIPLVPDLGKRYIAIVGVPANATQGHAIAIDENNRVFDPVDPAHKQWLRYPIMALLEVFELEG